MDVPMDEQTLIVELANVVWNEEAVPEHECTMECLLPRHNCSDSSSAGDVIHVVDVFKDNRLNDFYFDYSCNIFGAACNLATASSIDILDLMHDKTGHTEIKYAGGVCANQKNLLVIKFQKVISKSFIK